MGLIPQRLGPKLNLFLLGFVVMLGIATAALIFFGFERTQNDATEASREGLEVEGKRSLGAMTNVQASFGQAQLETTAGFAQQAARYVVDQSAGAPLPAFDATRLQTLPSGITYDAGAGRRSDLLIPAGATLDDAALRAIAESATLDALFPTLLQGYSGETRSPNFDAIQFYYQTVHNVTRIYPPVADLTSLPPVTAQQVLDETMSFGPEANPERKTVWTAPYNDTLGRGLVISAYVPVYRGDEYQGVMGVDLSLVRLVDQVDQVRPTPGGFAFYIDTEGNLLPTSAADSVRAEIDDPRNTEFAVIVEAMEAGRADVVRAEIAGREMFVAFTPLGGVGGTFAMAAPVDEVTQQAGEVQASIESGGRRTLIFALLAMGSVFVVGLGAASWLNRKLVLEPVSEMVTGTRALAAGDLGAAIPVRSGDELGVLAESFNSMSGVLRERTEALAEREEQYRSTFESANDGLIITRLEDGSIAEVNPAMCAMHGYTKDEFLVLHPTQFIHPDDHHLFVDYIATVADGREYRCRARDIRKDGSMLHVEVLGTPVTYNGRRHILGVVRDMTAQVEAEQILERSVQERTSELSALLQVSSAVASTLDVKRVARLILDELAGVAHYSGATLAAKEGDYLVILDSWGPHAEEVVNGPTARYPATSVPRDFWQTMATGQPVIIGDVREDSVYARSYRKTYGPFLDLPSFRSIRSWMAVPLIRKGEVVGVLTASHDEPQRFTMDAANLLVAAASQAAVAIENARLFEQAEERTRELSTLLDVSTNIASKLTIDAIVEVILQELRELLDATGASVTTVEGHRATHLGSSNRDIQALVGRGFAYSMRRFGPIWEQLERQEPVLIDDVRGEGRMAEAYRAAVGPEIDGIYREVRSWMSLPLSHQERLIGLMFVTHREPGVFEERDVELARVVANQAAVAIENARLFEETKERTRELTTLLDVSTTVASTIELQPLMQLILEQVQVVAEYDRAAVLILDDEGEALRVIATMLRSGDIAPGAPADTRFPVADAPEFWAEFNAGRAVIIDDARDDSVFAQVYRRSAAPKTDPKLEHVRSWMAVPLSLQDRVIGIIGLTSNKIGIYSGRQARLTMAIATQAAVAIENARLYEQTEEQSRESAALLQISNSLTSTLELGPLVRVILAQLGTVVDYKGSSVVIADGDELEILASRIIDPPNTPEPRGLRFPFRRDTELWRQLERLEPVIIDDIRAETKLAREYRDLIGISLRTPSFRSVQSWMAVPLAAKNRVIGFLSMSQETGYFTEGHARIASAVAQQAAVAIENARLYEQTEDRSKELATLLDVSRNVASTLELGPLLDLTLEQVRHVAPYDGASFLVLHGDMLRIESESRDRSTIGLELPTAGSLLWERARRGETVLIENVRGETPEAASWRQAAGPLLDTRYQLVQSWLGVPILLGDRPLGMLALSGHRPGVFTEQHARLARAVADQAAVAIENARLYEEAGQRTRELAALLDVSKGIASTLDRGELVGNILRDQLRAIIDYNGASVMLLDGDQLSLIGYDRENRGDGPTVQVPLSFPLERMRPLWDVMLRGEELIVDDVRGEAAASAAFRGATGELADTSLRHVRALLAVPLIVREKVIGTLTVSHGEAGFFTQEHARLVRAIADQAAVALENARLYEEASQRARETEALLRADAELYRSLSLDDVFQALCDVAVDVLGIDKCMVTTIEDESGRYTTRASRGLSKESLARMAAIREARPRSALATMTEPIITEDARGAIPEMREVFEAEGIVSTMDVPIRIEGTVRGDFALAHTHPHVPTADEQRLFQALADRASVAIQNAALYERAQQAASLEERQRLARELHDSVSQALYGIALGARTARTQLDRDPARAVEPMEYVLSLAEAGLAEMRALIFELRPESLQTEGLVAAIEKQVASTRARYGLDVTAELGAEPDVRLDVKEALYRVAQEALHNIVKHAHATHVRVGLALSDGHVALEVRDDGRGFDPEGSYPGHVGLHSMRERIEKLHGTITIASRPGDGASIEVRVPVPVQGVSA